jgi:hypothetical protein
MGRSSSQTVSKPESFPEKFCADHGESLSLPIVLVLVFIVVLVVVLVLVLGKSVS